MKQIACCILALLILFSLVGCSETQRSQEPNTDIATVSESTIPTETAMSDATAKPAVTVAPVKTKAPVEVTASPKPSPTPTAAPVFDVHSVEMQDTPGSSCFSKVGYDTVWEVLVVQFRGSGSVYTYSNFPESEWDDFIAADSLGGWYNKHIKGKYEDERIN